MVKAQFGSWDSPIDASMVAGQSISFQDLVVDTHTIYWSEMRPNENGRCVIVRCNAENEMEDILPVPFSARTRVHEYGGSAFTVKEGIIYFVNHSDQRIYKFTVGEAPVPVTPKNIYFADMHITPFGIIAIAEQHSEDEKEPKNFIAQINPDSGEVKTLYSGHDFYAQISVSSDAQSVAWIAWNHPNMPWDNNELWTATLNEQGFDAITRIDKDYQEQSFFQPQWNKKNQLIVVSDKSNWWNLYQVKDKKLQIIFSVERDIGLPLWVFNMSTWVPYQDGLACLFSEHGQTTLWYYRHEKLTPIKLPYTHLSQLRTHQDKLIMIAGNADKALEIICLNADFNYTVLKKSNVITIDKSYISEPEPISFCTSQDRLAYAYYYPPKNKDYQGLENTLPPLIVKNHGGPTAAASTQLNLQIQYWTSRGFAFVDVDYAGSTGYGRAFRKSLEGQWGIFDVDDCVAAVQYLIETKKVDGNKIAIMGSSAGGYTALAALTFTTQFKVGAIYYGVSDLEALAQDTHKFESKYLDKLVGNYPAEKKIYYDRSPLYHVDKLSAPVIFFQGLKDTVVPPVQAQKMFEALQAKNIKTKIYLFEDEQHGFRNSENIVTCLEAQLQFFCESLDIDQS